MTKSANGTETSGRRDFIERFFEDRPFISRRPFLFWPSDGEDVRLEEYKEGSTLVIRAELAGIDPAKDVTLTIVAGKLRLEVDKQEREETKERDYVRREFRYGSLVREIALPVGVSERDVAATYEDGILEVRVTVPVEASSVKTIPITAS